MLVLYPAIEKGEKEYGLTLHEVAIGIDEGGIVAKGALPLNPQRPVLDLYLDTVDTAANMLINALNQVAIGSVPQGVPQSDPGHYYSNPTDAEFKRYMQKGIFYADPLTTVQRISDAFTVAGTQDNRDLNTAIKAFIDGNTDTKNIQFKIA